MTSKEYIEYWDHVIKYWAENNGAVHHDERAWEGFQTQLMPQPYWGNPENCSAVIINFNPGGLDESKYKIEEDPCHFSKVGDENTLCGRMAMNYSGEALKFPLLFDEEYVELAKASVKWYKRREAWVRSLLKGMNPASESEQLPPHFALELCGWHSHTWKGVKDELIKDVAKQIGDMYEESIKNSKLGIGLAVGALFARKFLPLLGFKDVTGDVLNLMKPLEGTVLPDKVNNGTVMWQPTSTKRWYKVLVKDNAPVLCSWSSGGNHAPEQKEFARYEAALVKAIKAYID